MAKEEKKNKPRFINPPNKLRQKVGTGGIDERLLIKSQEFINTNEIDFTPIASDFLKNFQNTIKDAKSGRIKGKDAVAALISPVMQLKANGGMFRYQLVSDVADIALQFLERVEELNADGFDVIVAHEKTIAVIIANDLRGDGGSEGYALVKELHEASERYFKKYGQSNEKPEKKPAKKPAKKPKK